MPGSPAPPRDPDPEPDPDENYPGDPHPRSPPGAPDKGEPTPPPGASGGSPPPSTDDLDAIAQLRQGHNELVAVSKLLREQMDDTRQAVKQILDHLRGTAPASAGPATALPAGVPPGAATPQASQALVTMKGMADLYKTLAEEGPAPGAPGTLEQQLAGIALRQLESNIGLQDVFKEVIRENLKSTARAALPTTFK